MNFVSFLYTIHRDTKVSLVLPPSFLFFFFPPSGHRSGVLTAAHDQLGRESAVSQFQAGLQRALQDPGPSPASLAGGHQGAAQLQHLTQLLSTFRVGVFF